MSRVGTSRAYDGNEPARPFGSPAARGTSGNRVGPGGDVARRREQDESDWPGRYPRFVPMPAVG
jgi:hypothetical protein